MPQLSRPSACRTLFPRVWLTGRIGVLGQDSRATRRNSTEAEPEIATAPRNKDLHSVYGQAADLGAPAEHVEARRDGIIGRRHSKRRDGGELIAQRGSASASDEDTGVIADGDRVELCR